MIEIDPDDNSIMYIQGDATKPIGTGKKIIAHCCNNIGGWGSGFVVALSERWTGPEQAYRKMHESNSKDFHKLLGAVQFVPVGDDIFVANIIGQNGTVSQDNPQPVVYEALEAGLLAVGNLALEEGATVHMPRLGCGLAGGSWAIVEEIIQRTIKVPVVVYDWPGGKFNP